MVTSADRNGTRLRARAAQPGLERVRTGRLPSVRQPIDQLRYEEAGRSHLVKAKGVCEMPNPMGGPGTGRLPSVRKRAT
jgi:hypothetical protein